MVVAELRVSGVVWEDRTHDVLLLGKVVGMFGEFIKK